MPELPEVQTTVNGLRDHIIGLTIRDAWSGYDSAYFKGSETIKDRVYFRRFKKEVLGKKVVSVERRAKNILINLSGSKTIIVHMKMTGHLLFGRYAFTRNDPKDPWEAVEPGSLKDPKNRHIRFVITFSNRKNLALSDMRKFAKVASADSSLIHASDHLKGLGPEPLDESFAFRRFDERLNLRPSGKIKLVLMDQSVISGIGNIYADESLWHAGIHPLERVRDVSESKRRSLFAAIKNNLARGIDLGGDSMSDYRNISGEKGRFQEQHHAYQKTGTRCDRRGCGGTIRRMVVGGRGTHYCDKHQIFTGK